MPKSAICVDASLTLKLIFPEPDSHVAQHLWDKWLTGESVIIAPSLWAYEVISVIRNRSYRKLLDPGLGSDAIMAVQNLPVQLLAPKGLHVRAWQLASHFNRPAAYDAHYLALAEMAEASFWTADKSLYNAVRGELGWVKHLSLLDI